MARETHWKEKGGTFRLKKVLEMVQARSIPGGISAEEECQLGAVSDSLS